jgi:hypothetical protein
MFSYRSLLKQAWEITWKHKYLWFFGLFASIVAGGGSWEYQILTQNINQGLVDGSYFQLSSILALGEVAKNFGAGLIDLFRNDFWTILNGLSIILITAMILAFFIWLAVSSQAALVDNVKKIMDSKKKDPALSIRAGLTVGHKYFWPLLGLNIIIKVLVAAAFFIVSLPLLFMVISDASTLTVIYIILFVIFIPVAMGLSLMIKYAIGYNVLDNKSFVASLESASRLFKENWLVSVEMAVIIFLINFLASGAILVVLSLFLLPLLLLGLIMQLNCLAVGIILLAIATIIVFGSALTTFQTASWTVLFVNLKERVALAKLERIFHR